MAHFSICKMCYSNGLETFVNQATVQIAMLEYMVSNIRDGQVTSPLQQGDSEASVSDDTATTKTSTSPVVLVGHSFGSFISNACVLTIANAAILTGIGGRCLTGSHQPTHRKHASH